MLATQNFFKELSKTTSHNVCVIWVQSSYSAGNPRAITFIFPHVVSFFLQVCKFCFLWFVFAKKINSLRTKDFFSACCFCDLVNPKT